MYDQQYAEVTIHRERDSLTDAMYVKRITWEPANLPARLRRGEDLELVSQSFPIEKMPAEPSFDDWICGYLYIRTDAGMSYAYHRLMGCWRKHIWARWHWVEIRLILTLHVWGLAKVEPHSYITWACVGKR